MYSVTPLIFLTIFLLMFAFCLFIVGIFTAYFGSGKSRGIGVGLWAAGTIIGLGWLFAMWARTGPIINVGIGPLCIVWETFLILLAALLGLLAAVGLFLVAIMKS